MSIKLQVDGVVNFMLENNEITNFEFDYLVKESLYAKGSNCSRLMKITGDVMATKTTDPGIMAKIREWAKTNYKDPSYYHKVKATMVHGGLVTRETTFHNAFIIEYDEYINPQSGRGTFTILFGQKLDKRTRIWFDDEEEWPGYSEFMNQRAEKQVPPVVVADEDTDGNSPYWVQERHLAADRVRITGFVSLLTVPGIRAVRLEGTETGQPVPDGGSWSEFMGERIIDIPTASIPAGGLQLDVIRARRFTNGTATINLDLNATDVTTWYEVSHGGRIGWIPDRMDGFIRVEPITTGNNRVIMVSQPPNDPNRATTIDNLAEVWGNGWPDNPTGGILTSGTGRGTFMGANITGPENIRESGTASIDNTNQRGLVDGAIVTLAGTVNNRIRRGGSSRLDFRHRMEWIQVSSWRAGRWTAEKEVAMNRGEGRVITIPLNVTGRITRANGSVVNVVLNTRGNTDVQGLGNATHLSRWFAFYGDDSNEALRDNNNNRIRICVGPRVFAPNYPDDGQVWSVEPAHGIDLRNNPVLIDVLIKNRATGDEEILECVVTEGGVKAHTLNVYPHDLHDRTHRFFINEQVVFDGIQSGMHQTGIAYPRSWNASNESQWAERHMDGSTVEFRTHRARFVEGTGINPSDFDLIHLFVHD